MTTLDHAVQEECRRILLEEDEEEKECRRILLRRMRRRRVDVSLLRRMRRRIVAGFLQSRMRRNTFHVFMCAVKMAFHFVSSGRSHFTPWTCRRHLVKHVFPL
jgi:hypothetical protein